MRLAYFPEPQKDELLYSVLARFGRHLGLTASGAVAARLFGSRHVLATLDFPSRIADLAEQIARPLDLGAERIINQHTLLPYYETHQPPHRRQLARASMAGHGRSTHFRLGTAGFRVRPPSRLRFCPSCASYMLQTCGELYWRRAHQLPGVLVCPDHACVLREATFDMTSTSRQMYVAATLANCPANAASVLSETSPSIIERLRSVARASAALLDVPSAEEPCDVIERYRAKLATLGLMRSKRKVDVLALASAFSGFYEGVLPPLSIKAPSSSGSGYVAEMLRSRKAASSPLAHVLLDVFLEESTSSDVRRLAKPWVCFNPLADHTGLRVVTDFERRSHAGVVTGTFSTLR